MVDLTDMERTAIRAAVRPVAGAMEAIGWETRLIDLREDQVVALITQAINGFQDSMRDQSNMGEIPF